MSRRARRNHTSASKAKVALAAVKGDRMLAQLAEQFDLHPDQSASWKAQLEGGAVDVFGPGSGNPAALPAVDAKSLHAKIGELTLENEFLEGALSRRCLLPTASGAFCRPRGSPPSGKKGAFRCADREEACRRGTVESELGLVPPARSAARPNPACLRGTALVGRHSEGGWC